MIRISPTNCVEETGSHYLVTLASRAISQPQLFEYSAFANNILILIKMNNAKNNEEE